MLLRFILYHDRVASDQQKESVVNNPKQPNILILFTDMQRADTIHALGNPVIRTPNLDRLVQGGTSFTNCYSPSPVCVPARCSMHYGLYPYHTSCSDNGEWMDDNQQSFPAILAQNGYATQAIGKLHFSPDQLGPDQNDPIARDGKRGFQNREIQEECQSNPETDDYCKFLKDNNYDFIEPHGFRGEMYYIPQVSTLPAEAHPTQWIGDRTLTFLEKRKNKAKPWCLMSSFIHPHPPFAPPKPWHKLYRAPKMPLPLVPQNSEQLMTYANKVQNRYKYRDQGIDNNLMRNIKAFYYSSISFVDYQVGRILDKLEEQGELGNTLIIFSSDHGEYLGDYNCFGKRSMHDASAKVPMIAHYPNHFATDSICTHPVSLVDVLPTTIAAAGIDETYYNIDGVDLAKIATNSISRDAVYSQQLGQNQSEQGTYMIATEFYKYFYSAADNKEFLFDKISDPLEQRNAAANPFYTEIQKTLREQLQQHLLNNNVKGAVAPKTDGSLEWIRYPQLEIQDNPDANLIIQDDPGSVVPIPGYTNR